MDVSNWSDFDIENLINSVYKGSVSPAKLPVDLYQEIEKRINHGVMSAFAGVDVYDGSAALDFLNHFKYNVAVFSGAKTFQQVFAMSSEIFKDGEKQSFTDFKDKATQIFDTFNVNYLQTEYNMANNQALAGVRWTDIQRNKDIFPSLRYVTTGDDRVRPEHAILDGIERPVDDPFWLTYYPPNDWGCRCTIEQVTASSQATTSDSVVSDVVSQYKPIDLFAGNCGIDKTIFKDDHPYFTVPERYQLLKSTNWNLPTPNVPADLIAAEKASTPVVAELDAESKTIRDEFVSGTKLPADFCDPRVWRNCDRDISFDLTVPRSQFGKKDFFYVEANRRVYLRMGSGRWKTQKLWREMVSTHEIGHSVHYNLRLITNDFINDRTRKFIDDLRESMTDKFGHDIQSFRNLCLLRHSESIIRDMKYLIEAGVSRESERHEISGIFLDVIGGLTKGDIGSGHSLLYYRSNNGGEKEVFANMFQMMMMKDQRPLLVFQKYWPEAIDIAKQYFKDVLK